MNISKRLALLFIFVLVWNGAAAQCGGTGHCEERVRNIIYMIGDGMGVAQVTALIIGNDLGRAEIERATSVGLVRTFSADNRVTDSAAAGTALATGKKTGNGRLGIDMDGNMLTSVMGKSVASGMGTGFVVTCQVTHATPAAFYAKVNDRSDYGEIASQLVNSGIDVFMGGGLDDFTERADGRNLLSALRDKGYRVELGFDGIRNIRNGKVAAILSDKGSLPYAVDGRGNYLPEATAKALEILKNNDSENRGFFIMIEGSMIDYAGHDNDAGRLIGEMRDFDRAVGVAFDFADANPGTLVVVLADHETGGLAIPAQDKDSPSENGVKYVYGTGSHTAAMIPLFAYGTGACRFSRVMDNTDIPKIMEELLGLQAKLPAVR